MESLSFYRENIEGTSNKIYMATTKTDRKYTDVKYSENIYHVWVGVKRYTYWEILNKFKESNITIL